MIIAYIAHPIGGDVEGNLAEVCKIVRKINLEYDDVVPFVPYYCDVVSLDDSNLEERSRGIKNNHTILNSGMVDELWVYGTKISSGVAGEISLAKKLGIPIRLRTPHILQEEVDLID